MKINKTGTWGELYAMRYLMDKGYTLLDANYKTRFGEIDIIAVKKKYLCFVEVKTRGGDSISEPKEAVDTAKQKRLAATAELFIRNSGTEKLQPRFDVCEVRVDSDNKLKKINYIENAFDV